RLYRVDPLKPDRKDWVEVIPEGKDVLESVAAVGDWLAAEYMQSASSRLRLFDRDGKLLEEIKLPTLGTLAGLGAEWDGSELLYGFHSFTVPPTVYHLDLKTRKAELWGRVKADIDFAAYEVEQVKYPSKDGTAITMFLAHKKGLKQDGKNPTLLWA